MIPERTTQHDDSARPQGWRVILVGRTGLDQTLRRQRDIELVRTRDALDAIGELSDPIDEHSPERAVVIVAPESEPRDGERDAFLSALRIVDPGVLMIRVGEQARGYDGAVYPHDSADRIMETIGTTTPIPLIETPHTEGADPHAGPHAEPGPDPDHEPEREPVPEDSDRAPIEPEPETELQSRPEVVVPRNDLHDRVIRSAHELPRSASAPRPLSTTDTIDIERALAQALSEARPVLAPALSCLRARIGRDDILMSESSETPGAPVRSHGTVYGTLSCADRQWLNDGGLAVLERHADWLASWLRLEEQQRELRASAFTDELTGAWNRRYFSRFLNAAIERSRDARRTLTLLYFDIDDFKTYNDRYGHDAGDEILVETVRLLTSVIRPSDRVCRIGGDEFVVIFYEPEGPRDPSSTPPESIYDIAKRFQTQICNHSFPKLGKDACGSLTISGGLASYPWDGANATELLNHADELALESKRQGKNVIKMGRGAEGVCKKRPC